MKRKSRARPPQGRSLATARPTQALHNADPGIRLERVLVAGACRAVVVGSHLRRVTKKGWRT